MSASEIKLFGKIISFPCPILGSSVSEDNEEEKMQFSSIEDAFSSSSVSDEVTKKLEERQFTNSSNPIEDNLKDSIPQRENPKTPSIKTKPDLQNEQSENNSEITTKNPEKVLPCPRCDSVNTKFCYFNNNNSAQPRYFCKNCQRYWTSGGTMRNVPVGSGRRKNKNAIALNYGQIMVSKSIQASQPYGEIFDFGSNAHAKPCESFTLKPKFGGKSHNCFRNGFHGPERKELSSDGSSITSSDSFENGGKINSVIQESVMNNPGIWIFPCIYPPNCDSQILGKHSRETETRPNPEENNLWFPKALRIGDPGESLKSSIWSALEIKNEKNDFVKGKVVFKALKSNENNVHYLRDNSLVLQANPAALARSLNFHENA